MVDRSRSWLEWQRLCLLLILHFLLSFVLVALHELLLILGQLCLLCFKFFHSLICRPRSLKVASSSISKFLSLHLKLSSFRLSWHSPWLLFLTIADIDRRRDACTICRIKSNTLILEAVKLFVELRGVKLRLLEKSSEVVLLAFNICLSNESVCFILMLDKLQIADINIRCQWSDSNPLCYRRLGLIISWWLRVMLQ